MGFPILNTLYTSPLARALEIIKLVFSDVILGQGKVFRLMIKEAL